MMKRAAPPSRCCARRRPKSPNSSERRKAVYSMAERRAIAGRDAHRPASWIRTRYLL